jgi:hypothetical protein
MIVAHELIGDLEANEIPGFFGMQGVDTDEDV